MVEALAAKPKQRRVTSPEQEYDKPLELATKFEQYQKKLASNTKKETPRFGALATNPKQQRVELYGRVGTAPVGLVNKPEHLKQ